MKLHPWDEVIATVDQLIKKGVDCFQQFNCQHCGTKQTMEHANVFHMIGTCEECGKTTDIKKHGMNYMAYAHTPESIKTVLKRGNT